MLKKWTTFKYDYNFDHQMSLSNNKCCYSNNCLHFFKARCSILPFGLFLKGQGNFLGKKEAKEMAKFWATFQWNKFLYFHWNVKFQNVFCWVYFKVLKGVCYIYALDFQSELWCRYFVSSRQLFWLLFSKNWALFQIFLVTLRPGHDCFISTVNNVKSAVMCQ